MLENQLVILASTSAISRSRWNLKIKHFRKWWQGCKKIYNFIFTQSMEDKHRRGRRRGWSRRRRTASRWQQTRRCPTPPTWTRKCWPCSTCRRCWTRRTRAGCSWRCAGSSSGRSARDRTRSASLLTHRPTLRCRTGGWPPATIVLRWADGHHSHSSVQRQF